MAKVVTSIIQIGAKFKIAQHATSQPLAYSITINQLMLWGKVGPGMRSDLMPGPTLNTYQVTKTGFTSIINAMSKEFFSSHPKKKNHLGFTLIELLIVVSVIGVLSGIVLSVVNSSGLKAKTRDSQRRSDLKKVQVGLELYFADFRVYPTTGGAWSIVKGSSGILGGALSPNYMNSLPADPESTGTSTSPCASTTSYYYFYKTDGTGNTYVMASNMEVVTSNDGFECTVLNNWGSLGCGSGTIDVCYGVENP